MRNGTFKKGDDRINRKGRLPGVFQIADAIKATAIIIDPETRKQNMQAVIDTAFKLAIKGDAPARLWISDRGWGKALERIETNQATGPFFIIQRAADDPNEKGITDSQAEPVS